MDQPTLDEHGHLATVVVDAKKLSELTDELASLREQLAEAQQVNGLLRAVAEKHIGTLENILGWRIGTMGQIGEVYSGSLPRRRIDDLYLETVAAINGGALEPAASEEATDEL
jgi:tryptophan 2,3-dioxygenase